MRINSAITVLVATRAKETDMDSEASKQAKDLANWKPVMRPAKQGGPAVKSGPHVRSALEIVEKASGTWRYRIASNESDALKKKKKTKPKTIAAIGFGLNEDQQRRVRALMDWQEASLRSKQVLGGPIEDTRLG